MDPTSKTSFGFKEVAAGEKTELVRGVFSSVAQKYDVMNDAMSLGIHRLWKRHFVSTAQFSRGERVLDLAGGSGDISRLIAPIVGADGLVILSDINADMLQVGRDRLLDQGLHQQVPCAQINAEHLPFAAKTFDAVTIAFGLRNVTDKSMALCEMLRVLKIGGRALILEFSKMQNPLAQKAYDFYSFNVLPRLGQVLAGDADSYQYLAESIRKHPDQPALQALMNQAGFARTSFHNLLGGMVAIHRGYKI
jgi:demethylmenaquinone methyltransferase / 2-methoxy-6-polyprenyl-1,4-benzoquinol methylase